MRRFAILASLLAFVVLAVPSAFAWQTDTNATTDPTDYTPTRPSDILLGYNASVPSVWIAYGQTSNQWADAAGTNTPITSARITDGAIANVDLAVNSVAGSNLINGTITNPDLAINSIAGSNIIDGTITNPDLATDSVADSNIVDGTIGLADLSATAVTGAKIVDGTISNADLAATAVTGAKIVDGSISNADFGLIASDTNFSFYTVAAGTADCITNQMVFSNGIWRVNH